jgi:hypothetical protein
MQTGRRTALALALLYQLACVYECGSHGETRVKATARGGALGGDPDAETRSQRLAQWRALRHAAAPGSNAAAEAAQGEKSGEEPGDGLGTRLREWRSQRRSGERLEEGPAVVQEPDASSWRAIRQAQELGMSAAEVCELNCVPPRRKHVADCAIWGVVTTIFEPTESILLFAKRVTDACVVVVGDRKTNHSRWGGVPKNVFYLGPSEQESLCYTILQHVPWNHFGRKNIGYMYAIAAGAQRIFDFDDDNKLKAGMENDLHKTFGKCSVSQPKHLFYNPYPDLQDPFDENGIAWPRGFPLEFIRDPATHSQQRVYTHLHVAVVQSLADHDPDVDAIFRLTRRLPMNFASTPPAAVAIPAGTYAPWNAQATLFLNNSFFGLVLPVTVSGRVSDIWRSYITTRLLQEAGMHVVFITPIVDQHRNPHSYSADFQEELDLYGKVYKLIEVLETTAAAPESRMQDVYLMLMKEIVAAGILRQADYDLARAWVLDLQSVGYTWPVRQPRERSPYFHILTERNMVDGRRDAAVAVDDKHSNYADLANSKCKTFWTSDLHDGTRLDFTTMLMRLGHRVRNMGTKGLESPYPEFARQMLLPTRPLSNVVHRLKEHSSGMRETDARSVVVRLGPFV